MVMMMVLSGPAEGPEGVAVTIAKKDGMEIHRT
jgi:hypothetical protein